MLRKSGPSAIGAKADANNRVERRQAVLWPAVIVSDDGAVIRDCTMRDVSSKGAKIALPRGGLNLDTFFLIHVRDRTALKAAFMWRNATDLGVSYEAPMSLSTLPSNLDHLKKAWLQRAIR